MTRLGSPALAGLLALTCLTTAPAEGLFGFGDGKKVTPAVLFTESTSLDAAPAAGELILVGHSPAPAVSMRVERPTGSHAQHGRAPRRSLTRVQIGRMLAAASQRHGVPLLILQAVAWKESTWQSNKVSFDRGHGMGVMQIDDRSHRFAETSAVWDAASNIEYGTRYLASLRERHGSWNTALRRYNGGAAYPGQIRRLMNERPWLEYLPRSRA